MSAPRHICVLAGGPSAEREVSLSSGAAVSKALRSVGYVVSDIDPRGDWSLPPGTDVVFLALHGTYGEDGTVQQTLERQGVPFTGCNSSASRTAFDKVLTKQRLVSSGVRTPRFAVIEDPSSPWPAGWAPPAVLKPVRQGSSVGLNFVRRPEDWAEALQSCLRHDRQALLEELIEGRELTVALLEDQALPVVEIRPHEGPYDYGNKYTPGATQYLCPAPLDPEVTDRVQKAALTAFAAVGGRDYGRVDILLRADGLPEVLEVNTLPGMTETSLFPKAAAAAGMEFPALCQKMVELAWKRRGSATERIAVHVV